MRIGIIAAANQSIDEPFAGGMESHTSLLADSLKRRGHQVTIHAAEGEVEDGWRPVSRSTLSLSEQARSDTSMPAEGFMRDHHAYLSLMVGLDEQGYDVVHNNCLHYLPIAMSDAVDTPLVTTLHTPPTPWLESAIQLHSHQGCAWVSVSRSNAESWHHLDVKPHVIYNGVDLDRWRPGSTHEPAKAVWSGRLVPEKGAHLAIEAAQLAGLPLDLAGPIGDRNYFEQEIEPRLASSVKYLGHLDTNALRELVSRAAVSLVTPRWEEPFGLVVAESLAVGTPVAAFARGAIPELLDSACGVLVGADRTDRLAAGALECLDLDRTSCRNHAVNYFSVDRMVDEYVEVYESMRRRVSA